MLHTVGIERVLGMRLSVLDGAASAFNAELFRRLALGEDVGRAVTLARRRWCRIHGGRPRLGTTEVEVIRGRNGRCQCCSIARRMDRSWTWTALQRPRRPVHSRHC